MRLHLDLQKMIKNVTVILMHRVIYVFATHSIGVSANDSLVVITKKSTLLCADWLIDYSLHCDSCAELYDPYMTFNAILTGLTAASL